MIWLRERKAEADVENKKIRVATSVEEMNKVYRLTYDNYLDEGYIGVNPSGTYQHYPWLDGIPETTVLISMDDHGNLDATNSLTIDSDLKLHVDPDFPDAVEMVRRDCKVKGLKLASSWRIATAHKSLMLVKKIMTATIELGIKKGVDVCLFSFNPKHRHFYEFYLNLITLEEGVCHAVNNAPAVLMVGYKDDILQSRAMKPHTKPIGYYISPTFRYTDFRNFHGLGK